MEALQADPLNKNVVMAYIKEWLSDSRQMLPAEFKRVRMGAHLSQNQLASLLGVTHKTVWNYEHGYTPIPKMARNNMQIIERIVQ